MSLWEFAKGALLHATLATVATHEQAAPSLPSSSVASVARVATVACSKGADLDLAAIEERAAIAEFDGGLSRPLAEALARWKCAPPPGTPPRRWQRLRTRLPCWWLSGPPRALAAGWTRRSMQGYLATPHDRPDRAGLILGADGRHLTDVRHRLHHRLPRVAPYLRSVPLLPTARAA
jgi:hypothetical protein